MKSLLVHRSRFAFTRVRRHVLKHVPLYQGCCILIFSTLMTWSVLQVTASTTVRLLLVLAGTLSIVLFTSAGMRLLLLRPYRSLKRLARKSRPGNPRPNGNDHPVPPKDVLPAWDALVSYIGNAYALTAAHRSRLDFARRRLEHHSTDTDAATFQQTLAHFRGQSQKRRRTAIESWVDQTLPPADAHWSFEEPIPLLFRQNDHVYWKGVNVAMNIHDIIWWQTLDRSVKNHRLLWDLATAFHQSHRDAEKRKKRPGTLSFSEWIISDERVAIPTVSMTN